MDHNMVMMALELLVEHMEADILPIRHHMEEEIMVVTADTPASIVEQDISLGIS